MKTLKIDEEAWEKLAFFKVVNKNKTYSECIKTLIWNYWTLNNNTRKDKYEK